MASSAPPRRKHGRQSMEFDDRCVAEGSAWSTRAKEIVPSKKKKGVSCSLRDSVKQTCAAVMVSETGEIV